MIFVKSMGDGAIDIPLTNFTARIVGQKIQDDGVETRRLMEVEGRLGNRVTRFAVSAEEFAGMNWPLKYLGSAAVVYPGWAAKDHTRAAIQLISGEAPERRVFTHTGWRKIDETWCYVHAGGAIGPEGSVAGVEVQLPEALAGFILPDPPPRRRLREVINASLRLLEIGPDPVVLPLFCAVWRAVLGASDFSLHLAGPTGVGKHRDCVAGSTPLGCRVRCSPFAWIMVEHGQRAGGIGFCRPRCLSGG